ncbi:hypothetical protein NKI36_30450 [Mesorhizobium caraganae]|uniref:Uncharacterized protein n=1 Tax=Mesorhizobium caraganae TaxID=483206 RepID=A0ABV1Z883_9HYPH
MNLLPQQMSIDLHFQMNSVRFALSGKLTAGSLGLLGGPRTNFGRIAGTQDGEIAICRASAVAEGVTIPVDSRRAAEMRVSVLSDAEKSHYYFQRLVRH